MKILTGICDAMNITNARGFLWLRSASAMRSAMRRRTRERPLRGCDMLAAARPKVEKTMTPEEQRAEEQATIDLELAAFERRQQAFIKVVQQFAPRGNGTPAKADMDELDAADANWRAGTTEMDRISDEIRTGKRR